MDTAYGAEPVIEVERKFPVMDKHVAQLEDLGAKLIKRCTFSDVYWDTSSALLMTQDFWLRQRDGCWELKVPTGTQHGLITQYQELTAECDIMAKLNLLLSEHNSCISMKDLTASKLKQVASFTTFRDSYLIEGHVNVDIDETDFGYKIGELEILVSDQNGVQGALSLIEELIKKLGIGQKRTEGKLLHYLSLHNPSFYQKILSEA